MGTTATTPASLDGRRFEGVVLERGKTSGDADTLIFDKGLFRSTACDRYGYGSGPYRATATGDDLRFEAETESAQHGKLRWSGSIHGERLDGTLTIVRDGKPTGEKWVVAGEVK
jgi:hypothetical protein